MATKAELFGPETHEPEPGVNIVPQANSGLRASLSWRQEVPPPDGAAWQPYSGRAVWNCRKCGAIVISMQVHLDWHNSLSDDGWTVAQDEEPESEPETRYVAPAPGFGPEGLLVKGIRWKPSEDKLNEWAQAVWDTTLVNGADLTPEQAKHIAKCLWPDIIEWANDNYHGGI